MHKPALPAPLQLRIAALAKRQRFRLAGSILIIAAGSALGAGDGEKMYNDLREKNALYRNAEWQEYVTEIGERLLSVSPDAGKNYTFVVVDSPIVNAAATQDGYIFIYRGIIAYCRSEDELAGIIGHEIGHVVARHTKRTKGLNRLGGLLGWIGLIGTSSGSMKDLGDTLTATAVSREAREHELEADAIGAKLLARAGYDPLAMINVIYVLKEDELFAKTVSNRPSVYHGLFGSHPRNDKRLHDVVGEAVPLAGDEIRPPERDFWTMLNGLTFGDEAATGLVQGSTYYHSGLRIVVRFPEGWDLGNTASEVFGRDLSGASDGNITVQRQRPAAKGQTPEGYIRDTLKRDDIENGQAIDVNGYAAYVADVAILAGDAQRRKMAVVFKDGAVYLFKGELGLVGDPAGFERDFNDTLASFRAMTASDLDAANRQRIQVVMANPGDTYAKLAQKSSLAAFPEETLRVINGHYPRGQPRAGDYIKLVR